MCAHINWWLLLFAPQHTTLTCIQLIYRFNSSRLISWQISCNLFEQNQNDVKCAFLPFSFAIRYLNKLTSGATVCQMTNWIGIARCTSLRNFNLMSSSCVRHTVNCISLFLFICICNFFSLKTKHCYSNIYSAIVHAMHAPCLYMHKISIKSF